MRTSLSYLCIFPWVLQETDISETSYTLYYINTSQYIQKEGSYTGCSYSHVRFNKQNKGSHKVKEKALICIYAADVNERGDGKDSTLVVSRYANAHGGRYETVPLIQHAFDKKKRGQ